MSWRVVAVSSNAKIDYKMEYLVVRNIEEVKRIHLSEIGVLMLESTAISITAYAMCELVRHKIDVIFCDQERNPSFQLIPFAGSHDSSDKIRKQIVWRSEVKQAVWTEIIRQKILRQREHLCRRGLPQAETLTEYLRQVSFGDAANREGLSAKVYFSALFGSDFTRTEETPVNAALNYGYGIILSAVNREIAAAGYLNQLGIGHDNQFNPFNLGCDLMEPLRPLVDAAVAEMQPKEFGHTEKVALVALLNEQVMLEGRRQYFMVALRYYCSSLFHALQSGDISKIKWMDYE